MVHTVARTPNDLQWGRITEIGTANGGTRYRLVRGRQSQWFNIADISGRVRNISESVCSVCTTNLADVPPFMYLNSCTHVMCNGCFEVWRNHCHRQNIVFSCPSCRRAIVQAFPLLLNFTTVNNYE